MRGRPQKLRLILRHANRARLWTPLVRSLVTFPPEREGTYDASPSLIPVCGKYKMSSPDLPVISLQPLFYGGHVGLTEVARQIGAACRGIGFFYIIDHGITEALVAQTFGAAARFFAGADTAREKIAISRSAHNRGYVGLKQEKLDPSKPPDLKQAFNIGLELAEDDPDVVAGKPFRGPNFWPADTAFKSTCLAYFDAVWALGRDLHRAIAIDLGLAETFFADKLDAPMATLRLLNYPPMPVGIDAAQLGAGEHTDYGNITLLMTDEVGGLEVKARDGTWIKAPVIPGAFVCNIGDCLMRWTNDIYVSTPHRVVNPAGRERNSIAFFLDPNPDALVFCLPGCGAPKYPPVLAADYLRQRLDATYAHKTGAAAA